MKHFLIIPILLLLCVVPVFAQDFEQFQLLEGSVVTAGDTTRLEVSYPQNLTEGTLIINGRNTSTINTGVFDYGYGAVGCPLQAYNVNAPMNYSFDVYYTQVTDARNNYNANFTLTYEISNLQTFNLTRPVGEGTFDLLGACSHGVIYRSLGTRIAGDGTLTYPHNRMTIGDNFRSAAGYYNMDVTPNFTLPAGAFTTTVHAIDALTGGQIHGATIEIKDVENGSWVNSTADADGQLDITTLTTHHLDIYGSYPGVYTSSMELGADIGIADYNLPMYPILPPAPPGYVNVLVYVKDAVTDYSISGAKVDFRNSSNAVESHLTDTYGAVLTTWRNNSAITFTTSKSNYYAQTISRVTPDFGDVLYTVRLPNYLVIIPTAVPTDAIGNPITAVPTYLQFCNPAAPDYDPIDCGRSQDNDLMKQLRDNGSTIMSLAILAIIFGLLKMIFKF